jgi:hypothetical protein
VGGKKSLCHRKMKETKAVPSAPPILKELLDQLVTGPITRSMPCAADAPARFSSGIDLVSAVKMVLGSGIEHDASRTA